MGVELLEIGVKVRKGVVFTIRGCYRSVCNHPFLVGTLCFLIFLYRLSPFLFQLLLSASPILVCTAVLLGTLLSFGQPNLPEIEVEERTTTFEAVSLKTGVLGETAVVEENESYYVERFSERRWEEAEKSTDLSVGKLGEVQREASDDTAPLIEERSPRTNGASWEGDRELGDLGCEQKSDWIETKLNNGEVLENHYASDGKVNDALIESDDEKSEADSFGSEKVNVDSLDSPPRSPWARVEEREDREEEDDNEEEDDGSDSGSSLAESSSPDASMADIMPMLDELHPLLDEEGARTVHITRDGSDAASQKSSSSGHELDDEDSENHDVSENADDDNEGEEDGQGDKEEETKSAITWTEEDQKNLMDLGSSEIERNQRLENLILRRRSRKMLADRNLIDLDGSDLPFNIAPISTRRQNPFDLPNDNYYDNLGLPPIPGSAPSVLLQRQNPFDIPYDSSEEKPDLMGDGFQEEFKTSQSRESVFRRHESFNLGPSNFAPKRKDLKMRPYFVPEGSVSEESSSSRFQRQSSELSESKLSSVPDTESISSVTSVEDQEDRKISEEDNLVISQTKEVTEEGPSGDPDLISQKEVDTEEDVNRESETIFKMESVSEQVGHGSESSEEGDDSLELGQVEKRDDEVGELESRVERYTRDSSSSSLSEESERVFTVTEGEGLSMLEERIEERMDDVAQEAVISAQTSVESTDLNDVPYREPVYDTSPRVLSKNVSTSLIASDVHPESDLGSLLVIDKTTVSSIERESEGVSQETETDVPTNNEILLDLSVSAHPVDESRPIDAVDIKEHDYITSEFSGVESSIPLKSSDEATKSSEDQIPEQAQEHSVPSGKHDVIEVNEPPFEGQPSAEHSVGVEEIVQSPDSDADEKLISTVSSGEATAIFHDKAINEPNLIDLNEVQASTIPAESFVDGQVTLESNMPEFREFDDYVSTNINSPSSPQRVSIPPTATETTTSHVDVQMVVEEVDEIKEIDDGLLSELDNVGDFSVNHLGSDSTEFEKHIDSIGEESLPSPHQAGTTDFETHSVEANKIQDAFHPESSREHVDSYEEGVERISELQTSETSRAENIEVSRMEFNENDSPDSLVNHNFVDTFSVTPELEDQPVEDIDAIPLEKAEPTSLETEITGEGSELPGQGQFDTDTPSGMPELEASTIEDIDLAFKKISSNGMEKPVALKEAISAMPESRVQPIEDVDAVHLEKDESRSVETETPAVGGGEVTSRGQVDTNIPTEMAELEASKIEDIDLAFKKISSNEIEKPVASEPPQAERHSIEDATSMMHESEMRSIEGVGGGEISGPVQVDTDTNSGMAELEASKIEDIDLAFEQTSFKETEKPVDLEPPQAELAVGGAIAESFEDRVLNKKSSAVSTHETSVLEPIKDATMDQDSVDPALNVVGSEETQRASSELHVSEPTAVDVKSDKVGPSEELSGINKSIAFATEKPDSPSFDKGKGKISRSSSSSSSSSSDSSSSDSDKE